MGPITSQSQVATHPQSTSVFFERFIQLCVRSRSEQTTCPPWSSQCSLKVPCRMVMQLHTPRPWDLGGCSPLLVTLASESLYCTDFLQTIMQTAGDDDQVDDDDDDAYVDD